jgi:hypothetical protein
MSEFGKIKARDLLRINVNLPDDVLFWCRELGCNEARLQVVVRKVGSTVEAVRREITGRWK